MAMTTTKRVNSAHSKSFLTALSPSCRLTSAPAVPGRTAF